MELKYLNTFKTIIEEGSFSAAAEKLNYTNSTITFQISQIEAELSATLFEKVGRKMVLTSAGKNLVPYVDEVLSAVDKLQFFEQDISQCCGTIRVGVAESYLGFRLPPALRQFVSQAPKARLFIRSMNCYEIRNELINGNLDIGIFYRDIGGYESSLVVSELEALPVCLVASPSNADRFSDFKTPQSSMQIPLIINEPNCIFRQIFEQYLRSNSIILDHTIELDSIDTIKKLVASDVGVSFLPKFTVEQELNSGTLAEIETNITDNCLHIAYGYHKNKWLSPLAKLFIDCIEGAV